MTDEDARVRTPPPQLKLTGARFAFGGSVTASRGVRKGGKIYYEVEEVMAPLVAMAPLRGWTLADNLAAGPGPGDEPEPGHDDDDDILIIEEGPDDQSKIELATRIAGATEDDRAELEDQLAETRTALKSTKDELSALGRGREHRERRRELKQEQRSLKQRELFLKTSLKAIPINAGLAHHLALADFTVEQWFANMVPSATFLGIPITGNRTEYKGLSLGGVHLEMYERLKRAEQAIVDETGLPPDEAGRALGLRAVSGLRMPDSATLPGGEQGGDLHSFGMAVDINADRSNPYLRASSSFEVVKRATLLITGTEIDVGQVPPKGTGSSKEEKRRSQAEQMYDVFASASGALEAYFQFENATEVEVDGTTLTLEDAARRFALAGGEDRTVAEWQTLIGEDRARLERGDWTSRRDPAEGLMDLDKRLVLALAEAGLVWGLYESSKDLMHFDVRDGSLPYKRPNRNWH